MCRIRALNLSRAGDAKQKGAVTKTASPRSLHCRLADKSAVWIYITEKTGKDYRILLTSACKEPVRF